jgi:hypothetical protein
VPEIKMGRTYLRPITGTSEGPQKNAFNAPRLGRTSSAVFCAKFPRFRDGQQQKLREMILVKFGFWSFYLSAPPVCAFGFASSIAACLVFICATRGGKSPG